MELGCILCYPCPQTPHAARGPTQLVIYDIHALQNLFYFTVARTALQLRLC